MHDFKPAFDRLDAIMSIEMDDPEAYSLVDYRPIWSGAWHYRMTEALDRMNEEYFSD